MSELSKSLQELLRGTAAGCFPRLLPAAAAGPPEGLSPRGCRHRAGPAPPCPACSRNQRSLPSTSEGSQTHAHSSALALPTCSPHLCHHCVPTHGQHPLREEQRWQPSPVQGSSAESGGERGKGNHFENILSPSVSPALCSNSRSMQCAVCS